MVDLVVTAANVQPAADSVLKNFIAGATITAGQTLYVDANGKVQPCVATTQALSKCIGVAMNGGSAGQPIVVCIGGGFNPGATAAIGTIYNASANAGGIAPAADAAAGNFTSMLGFGTAAGNIEMPQAGPFYSGVSHA